MLSGAEGAMGVTEFVQPWWQVLRQRGSYWVPYFPMVVDERQEKVEENGKYYVDNGSLYWLKTEAFFKQRTWFVDKLEVWPMPYERSIDINTETDFEVAEFLAKKSLKMS